MSTFDNILLCQHTILLLFDVHVDSDRKPATMSLTFIMIFNFPYRTLYCVVKMFILLLSNSA